MATTVETFNGPRVEIIDGCFVAESHLAREYVADLGNGYRISDLPNLKLSIVYTENIPIGDLDPHDNGSEAHYKLDVLDDLDRVLLWYLNPKPGQFETTSEHVHPTADEEHDKPGIPETYYILSGRLDLGVGENPDRKTILHMRGDLRNPHAYKVLPGHWHQGRAYNPVAVMIRMENAALYPLEDQHRYTRR